MIYDGDCGFCLASVEWLRGMTGDRLEYRASQEAAADFPGVPAEAWRGSVQFIDVEGRRHDRAEAVFCGLATRWAFGRTLRWMYGRAPGFARICDAGYDAVARNRGRLSRLIGRTACRLGGGREGRD